LKIEDCKLNICRCRFASSNYNEKNFFNIQSLQNSMSIPAAVELTGYKFRQKISVPAVVIPNT